MKRIAVIFAVLLAFVFSGCANEISYDNSVKTNEICDLKVHFISLKNGECTFAELPNGEYMLIDCGSNRDFPVVYEYLRNQNVSIIDYLVVSSFDEAHAGGAEKLIQSFQINNMYISAHAKNVNLFNVAVSAANSTKCRVEFVCGGSNILDEGRLCLSFVSPINDYKKTDDYALTLMISFGENSILLPGDCGENAQNDMAEYVDNYLKSDVIKVSGCLSPAFLQKANPKIAFVPHCANPENSEKTLKTLSLMKTEIFKTDVFGNCTLQSDGKNISCRFEKTNVK